jgi:hypothetical protein
MNEGPHARPFVLLPGGNGQASVVISLRTPYLAQFVIVGLARDGKCFALARFGGVIAFGGDGEALPDVVNRDIDALTGAEEMACA